MRCVSGWRRASLGEPPVKAAITLSGSSTGAGHGTDRAIVAGLLNMEPDDMKIPESFREAEKAGLEFGFIHDNNRRRMQPKHGCSTSLSASGRDGDSGSAGVPLIFKVTCLNL